MDLIPKRLGTFVKGKYRFSSCLLNLVLTFLVYFGCFFVIFKTAVLYEIIQREYLASFCRL